MNHKTTTPSGKIGSPSEAPSSRQGWEEQYQHMAENGDDALLDSDVWSLTKWDETEWEWQCFQTQ